MCSHLIFFKAASSIEFLLEIIFRSPFSLYMTKQVNALLMCLVSFSPISKSKMHHTSKRLKISENSEELEINYEFKQKNVYFASAPKGMLKFLRKIQ